MRTLLPALLLAPALAVAAIPTFDQSVACPPLRLRLPKVEAQPMPAMEAYRFVGKAPDGSAKEFDAYPPEMIWRRDQRLGVWADKDGNRYELAAPKSLLGGPYPRAMVTQEEYDKVQAKAGAFKPSTLGQWLNDWVGGTASKPQRLSPLGGVRMALFATVGNDTAALVFTLKSNPNQPYALLITAAGDPPAKWRAALTRALAGFGAQSQGLSGQADDVEGWITIERPPYRVHTDLPKRDRKWLGTLLTDMGVIRRAYTKVFPEPYGTKIPISVIRVFADPDEYRAYAGEGMENTAGHFSSLNRELVVMGDAEEDSSKRRRDDILSTSFHEGFHQYLFLITPPLSTVPIWFNEGHATYFETFRVRGNNAKPSDSARLEVARKATGLRSAEGLARLLAYSQPEFYAQANDCYAVAWLFVHWLRTEAPPALAKTLDAYYKLICEGKSQVDANAAVYTPQVLQQIAEGLEDYLSKHKWEPPRDQRPRVRDIKDLDKDERERLLGR